MCLPAGHLFLPPIFHPGDHVLFWDTPFPSADVSSSCVMLLIIYLLIRVVPVEYEWWWWMPRIGRRQMRIYPLVGAIHHPSERDPQSTCAHDLRLYRNLSLSDNFSLFTHSHVKNLIQNPPTLDRFSLSHLLRPSIVCDICKLYFCNSSPKTVSSLWSASNCFDTAKFIEAKNCLRNAPTIEVQNRCNAMLTTLSCTTVF
jgi:hypothetical protein